MDGAMVLEKMYYIIDGRGNYYRINDEDQLIVSQDIENADLFELQEANKRINTGMKRYFYSILPADKITSLQNEATMSVEGNDEEEIIESHIVVNQQEPYDIEQMEWKDYLLHFSYVISGLKKYQDKLNQELSEVDMCICDLLHYLELYDLDDEDYVRVAGMIKEYREKRRVIKDKAYMVESFQKTIGTNANLSKAKEGIKLIQKLDCRRYKPRMLPEIFTDTLVPSVRYGHAFDGVKEKEEQKVEEREERMDQMVETVEVLERRETIFDSKANDWACFVSEQANFFADIKQYICNLKISITEIDDEIEQVMCKIDESNCNAAQGYKTFKQLKELRSKRKELSAELDSVQTITQCFDCEAMHDAYKYCEERIERI